MTILTTGVVGAGLTVATGGIAVPALTGVALGALNPVLANSVSAVSGMGAVTGGLTSAFLTETSAAVSAAVGSASAAAVALCHNGAAGLAAGLTLESIGSLILGCSHDSSQNESKVTFDCWKPLLHDESVEPSSGKLLKEVFADPRIRRVMMVRREESSSKDEEMVVIVENVWDEKFRLEYALLPESKTLAAHAVRVM